MKARARAVARVVLGDHFGEARVVWRRTRPYLPWNWATRTLARRGSARFVADHGLVVTGGPFQGMTFAPEAVGSVGALVPKLLGAYERELHGMVETALSDGPATVVNVGAGDGYYAVGLALRAQDAVVHAFDIDPVARRLCSRLAAVNGVAERVRVADECGPDFLRALPPSGTLLVIDCEGCERQLLVPEKADMLRSATILLELHEVFDPGLTQDVLGGFRATHDTQMVGGSNRDPGEYRELAAFPSLQAKVLIGEGRPEVGQWALLTPKGRPPA